MIQKITKINSKIKDLIRLRMDSKFRNTKSLFYIEGFKILIDTPFNLIHELYLSEDVYDTFIKNYPKYYNKNIYLLNENIFDKVKDTVNSQGYIATVKYNVINSIEDLSFNKFKRCILLDNINDPGNLGTIIRLAEASGIDLIVLANNCCNIYNPKVIRASMSSIFRTNILVTNNIPKLIKCFKDNNFEILATSLSNNTINYNEINYVNKYVVVFGNESNGVNKDIIMSADKLIKIPMCGKIESLNVAISASIICYEIARQNNFASYNV